jgi:hypothetical protein
MKKNRRRVGRGELRAEYDFSKATRGKHRGRVPRIATVVVLEPDIAEHFKTSASVNSALRTLVAKSRPRRKKKAG